MEVIFTFYYMGKNAQGQKISGYIQSETAGIAKLKLREQGILHANLRKTYFNHRLSRITPHELSVFSRQFATLVEANIPITQALDIIGKGQISSALQRLVLNLKEDISQGLSLAEAMNKYPGCFNDFTASLVAAGEHSGSLPIMLHRIASYREQIEKVKKNVKRALTYPIAVLLISVIIFLGLLFFVVPQFEILFHDFGAELPTVTRYTLLLSKAVKNYWFLIFGVPFALGYGVFFLHRRWSSFANCLNRISLRLPILGLIIKKSAITRFMRTLSTTFAAGLPLVDALTCVAGATGNRVFAEATWNIRAEVIMGQMMHPAMAKTRLFPHMVLDMILVGEESGNFEKMLNKIADFYEEEVENAVNTLCKILEPLIMCFLGIMVSAFIIAMYLPVFKLGLIM
ncbi:MAG: type II secretion system protein F [Legionella sp. 40-6]|nr:type II secretion system F family protein [Legionella sp.]OJX93210.1 MAG: type II secretion system protein F [Legionella sp. 40-6]